jgi:hypothetical protein
MKKENKVINTELNKLVDEVLDNSTFLRAKNVYCTHYFWLKDHNKYQAIFADNIENFGQKVREQSEAFILDNKNKQ